MPSTASAASNAPADVVPLQKRMGRRPVHAPQSRYSPASKSHLCTNCIFANDLLVRQFPNLQCFSKYLILQIILLGRFGGNCPFDAQFPSENANFPALSTKLSTGSVDKGKNLSVYRDLGQIARFGVSLLLQRMIFL
ncbi:hypothetical protein [Massilia cavernae]|uniref:hypothetical protein n=1 Tax=Massilia cavernae TaxID=2320864 RepID=UPI0011C41745|nr:hypothetical protein [Massilia cavernae]